MKPVPILLAFCVAALAAASPASAAGPEGGTIAVETTGSLPGFKSDDIAAYLAARMNAARIPAWRFAPAAGAGAKPGDRIEWSFKLEPSAIGTVRTYGFLRSAMDRLTGVRHYITIEAKLYLGGVYQDEILGQATILEGPGDPDLGAEIAKLARLLIADAADDQSPRGQQAPAS
jgi:hypothetical protein